MKILYKFPSRNRPDKFFKAIENIADRSKYAGYKILASLDIDDDSMTTPQVKERLKKHPEVTAMFGTSQNKIHSCNRDMEFSGDWDIVVLMSDDMEFLIDEFDRVIIGYMSTFFPDTDGMLHFPDSHGKHELCVLSIMGRKYYQRFGYLYHPDYVTMFCDNEYTEVARILNRYVFVPFRIFDHYHHIWGMSEQDALNVKNDDLQLYLKDNQTYLRRKSINYGINIFQ